MGINIFNSKKQSSENETKNNFKDILSQKDFGKRSKTEKLLLEKSMQNLSSQTIDDSFYEEEQKQLPLIGHLNDSLQYKIVGLLAVIAIAVSVSGIYLYGTATKTENSFVQLGSEFSSDLQRVNVVFSETILGKVPTVENLNNAVQKTNLDFEELKKYNANKVNNIELMNIQGRMEQNFKMLNDNANILTLRQDLLLNNSTKLAEFNNHILQINNQIDSFTKLYTQQQLNQNELINALSLKASIQGLNSSLITILLSERINTSIIESFNRAKQDFTNSFVSIKDGDASRAIRPITQSSILIEYQKLNTEWSALSDKIDLISSKSADLISIREISTQNEKLIEQIISDNNAIIALYKTNDLIGLNNSILIITGGVAMLLISLVLIFYIYSFQMYNIRMLESIENKRNQQAIIELTAELIPLQDGDLTKKTSVTGGITTMIADSINATIDSLSSLVKKIKDSSLVMREKTNSVKLISIEMLSSNEQQAEVLNETGSNVINITKAIEEISIKTEASAKEAQKSVEISEEGETQVQDSVKAMEEINNNINETVHLMKKVNDSSKQISEILGVLADISENTSILALNATVQASKAGEAGKGFKIVADSIQSLADNASDQNRRVGALISALQTDIIAVEKAVHKTTGEVSKGVELSQKAGESLNKITVASRKLSQTVGAISEETKIHAISAKKVSDKMQEILETTESNKNSTQKTADSISEISDMANELGHSVQTFQVK